MTKIRIRIRFDSIGQILFYIISKDRQGISAAPLAIYTPSYAREVLLARGINLGWTRSDESGSWCLNLYLLNRLPK